MYFICQKSSLLNLQNLALSRCHTVLISGPASCGKTYLAGQYQKMIVVDQFIKAEPNVGNFRDILDELSGIDTEVVVCVENLDLGNNAAAQVLLKSLEEPSDKVYYVITCRNIRRVPSTIISRSVCINTNSPTDEDIENYAIMQDANKFSVLKDRRIWRCVKSFDDVDTLFRMSSDNQVYFENIPSILDKKKTISDIQWALSHYEDNTSLPVNFAIRYIMYSTNDRYIKNICLNCLNSLSVGRIGESAILAKFVLEFKYGG